MAQNIYTTKRGTVITTDATTTTLDTYTVPANSIVGTEIIVVAKDGSNNAGVFKTVASATRSGAGASIVGSAIAVITPILSVTLATATLTIDVSGNDVRIRATGVTATTIEWMYQWSILNN